MNYNGSYTPVTFRFQVMTILEPDFCSTEGIYGFAVDTEIHLTQSLPSLKNAS